MLRTTTITAAALLLALAAPAMAGGTKDRVHADSFGNLVIHSPAGYKRIIVGQGDVADSYNLTGSYYEQDYEQPEIVYLDEGERHRSVRRCSRPPHVWHGRSYMYGLEQGVVPQAPLVCR
jgi:hypothetical protein